MSRENAIHYKRELTISRLVERPALQSEAIARHYAAHAMMAREMAELVNIRQYGPDENYAQITELLDDLAEIIKANHLADFGIPLSWSNTESTGNLT